jgi:predicted AAA+ superfamily ATPase
MYEAILRDQTRRHRQMAFVAGPRQVGKTTTCRALVAPTRFLSWDNQDDRALILAGPRAVAERVGIARSSAARTTLVFDELHRYGRWKTFLKGFFDTYEQRARIVITGSSRLDVYRRGGDSMMGRYFLYRMHPLSVGELLGADVPETEIRAPRDLDERKFQTLWEHGGFPEPFVEADARFSRRWRELRTQQLVREDVRDLTRIRELDQMEHLVALLSERSGTQLSYSSLATDVRVSVDSMRRWIECLVSLHHGFLVRPWFKNVARSLRKEPKWYGTDWSRVPDLGRRAETFVACHLLKAVQGWTDLGFGAFELRYLRDKDGREVDFVVVRDQRPWFLVEVKLSGTQLPADLHRHASQLGVRHAFAAVLDLPFEPKDCFTLDRPAVVPARTLLSQLL